jgi:multidrug efflux system membrane fusion protein
MRQMHTLPTDAWDRAQTIKLASGKLQSIDNQIDTTTGTVKLRAAFDNKERCSFPQPVCEHEIACEYARRRHAGSHQRRSAQWAGCFRFLYVARVERRACAILRRALPTAADLGEGINPGEVVATSSFEKLQDGSKVVVSKQAAPANSTEDNTP